jgi:hypothetical protein
VAAVWTLTTAAPRVSMIVSSGRRDPLNGFAFKELSICSAKNLSSDGDASPRQKARETLATLAHPLESPSAVRRNAKLRPKCRRHGFRISLEIV